jgi:signal transduction histidine kinase
VDEPTARIVAAVDAERRGLERRLHDGAQQQLVAIAVSLQLLEQLVDADPAAAKALLGEIRDDVRDALAELRLLAARLWPLLPGTRGLAVSLRAAAAAADVAADIAVPSTAEWSEEAATTVYLCCLEVLQSTGAGTRVSIDVRDEDGKLVFEVISASAPGWSPSLMEARVAALGGRLTTSVEPAQGTRLTGTIPLRDG